MPTIETFTDIALSDLLNVANEKHSKGYRAVQVLATNTENGIDLTYTFNQDNVWENYRIQGITKEDSVPSLQQMYLCLFPFENEVVDLFGVKIDGMALDFEGRLYDVAVSEPMTIISPEVKAAREKAKKAAAAKAKPAASAKPAADIPVPLTDEEIEAKVAAVAPEKQDKVRAALKAKQKKDMEAAAAAKAEAEKASAAPVPMTDEEIEAKVAAVAPEKQDKVRAALKAKQKKDLAAQAQAGKDGE